MDINRILSELDAEITRLQGIRAALTGLNGSSVAPSKGRRGRPKGSKNLTKAVASAAKAVAAAPVATKSAAKKAKRKLSPEGRKRIADAMKKRWAERRKQAAK
jgi:hypothetical protein